MSVISCQTLTSGGFLRFCPRDENYLFHVKQVTKKKKFELKVSK